MEIYDLMERCKKQSKRKSTQKLIYPVGLGTENRIEASFCTKPFILIM